MAETIKGIQDEIISEFDILGDDRESKIFYIMELGATLPKMEESEKVEHNIIKGCQSKVWLTAALAGEVIKFSADSNTEVTKGLISLLIRVLSGQKPQDIMQAELFFIEKIGMGQLIGSQRSNGLSSMIKQMKLYALAFQTKLAGTNT
ncbi:MULTISPECIES: SufE family protein [unclassified Imperialibacter]|uniref:SufE family protein n=1 Tax=unclassified Imperialibacter TaxID=2629706 RepID=UPI001259ABD2|nr:MULTISPECIES: SufE family protein [unclassified Imperialibacter]CAD5257840.1 Cysteine desulfuration protein sufE [Imperialibacter sp. 89]CAD5272852.1 Cysteine desulfuration protein sufE [Imperialibacter sp. 75]VVT32443.1 Cysteine desulfuration protein sufE [Imperialibacter sp. EC-SDR9]